MPAAPTRFSSPLTSASDSVIAATLGDTSRRVWRRPRRARPMTLKRDFLRAPHGPRARKGPEIAKVKIWIYLKVGDTMKTQQVQPNGEKNDKPEDLGVPHFQTNPYIATV